MSEILYETSFNWRLTYQCMSQPNTKKQFLQTADHFSFKENNMFLSAEQLKTNFFDIRNWLYDRDNVNGDFKMYGILSDKWKDMTYVPDRQRLWLYFKGVAFAFEKIVNAAHFRLMWNSQRLDNNQ